MSADTKKGGLVLEDRLYTETHEWAKKVGDGKYQVGITDYAQDNLKDIYAVELPKVGERLEQFQAWGQIESEKGASELLSPLSGEVVAINKDGLGDVFDTGETAKTYVYGGDLFNINKAPYETWLLEIETADESQVDNLLNPEDYRKAIASG
ncbi:MAG: glycine cleavage system protein H [Deltaproteobacteria bacterium]|nr:glycine cleavage system protein H [Deltaproteobacteria bacterium]